MEHTYTGFIRWPSGDAEEIDVRASSYDEARAKVQQELDADYEPFGIIFNLVQRANGVLFI